MHILVMPSWFPLRPIQQNGEFSRQQALLLSEQGITTNVMYINSLKKPKGSAFFEIGLYTDNGINVYYTHVPHYIAIIPFLYQAVLRTACARLYKFYCREEGKPDIIHSHVVLHAGYLGSTLCGNKPPYLIITEHFSKFMRQRLPPWKAWEARQGYGRADRLLAVSPALAQAIQPYCHEKKIGVIGNVVDEEFFFLQEKRPDTKPFVFSAIGRLDKNKDFHTLIRGFHDRFFGKDVILNIAGKGSQINSLRKLAHNLQIEKQIYFLGKLSREQVRNLLQTSHVVVSSSRVETFALTLIEGMACGLPVIATRSGGPDSYVDDTSGILVNPGDVAEIGAAMAEIRKRFNEYNAKKIRQNCIRKFGRKQITGQLIEEYQSLFLKNFSE